MNRTLHPDADKLLQTVLRSNDSAPLVVEQIRATNLVLSQQLAGPGEEVARTWNDLTQTSTGPLEMRCYAPTSSPIPTLLLFVHGGGWVSGTLDSYDTFCRALALRTGSLVASLAYSLSPEALHPQPIHEVAETIQRAPALAAKAGYTVQQLAVCGDSAGGFLIATAMHHLARTGADLPDAAIFLYPIADLSMQQQSYRDFASGFSLTRSKMEWYWAQYLGREVNPQGDRFDPYLVPLHSPELHRFPRSLIVTAEFDPLHDEGIELAQCLAAASVPVQHLDVPGQIHGFLRFRRAFPDPEWGPDALMKRIGHFLHSPNG